MLKSQEYKLRLSEDLDRWLDVRSSARDRQDKRCRTDDDHRTVLGGGVALREGLVDPTEKQSEGSTMKIRCSCAFHPPRIQQHTQPDLRDPDATATLEDAWYHLAAVFPEFSSAIRSPNCPQWMVQTFPTK